MTALRLTLGLLLLRLLCRRRLILARLVALKLIFILTDIPGIDLVIPILPVIPLTTLGESILVLELVIVVRTEACDFDLVVIHDNLVVVVRVFLLVFARLGLLLRLLGVQCGLFTRDIGLLLLSSGISSLALSNVFGLQRGGVGLCFMDCGGLSARLPYETTLNIPNSWNTVSPSPFLLPTSPSTILTNLNSILGPISTNLTAFLDPFLFPRPT